MQFSSLESGNSFVRIGIAVENQNFRFWRLGRHEQVEGEDGAAGTLEASGPVFRPPFHFYHRVGQEGLFRAVEGLIECLIHFFQERFVNVVRFSGFETEYGGIANMRAGAKDGFVKFHPVMNDAITAWFIIKETVDIVHDDDIYIQKERRPQYIRKSVFQNGQFKKNIGPLGDFFRIGIGGDRYSVDAFVKSGWIIRTADETEGSMHMPLDRPIKDIGVTRRVTGSPLQTKEVALRCIGHDLFCTVDWENRQEVRAEWSKSLSTEKNVNRSIELVFPSIGQRIGSCYQKITAGDIAESDREEVVPQEVLQRSCKCGGAS